MPKSPPFASPNIKKPSLKKKPVLSRGLGMGSAVKQSMPSDKLKSLLGLLVKGGGMPSGQR